MRDDLRSRSLVSGCYVGIAVALIGLIGVPVLTVMCVKFLVAAAGTIAAVAAAVFAIIRETAIVAASLIVLAGIAILRGWEVALRWYGHGWHRGLVESLLEMMP